jgi:chemotaxis protein MotB
VAYADFVTAMMALFMVLWLMNSSKPIQEAVSGYFRDPSGTSKKVGSDIAGPKDKPVASTKESMEELKKQIEKAMSEMPDFDKIKNHIEITITSEGLRIELTESAKGTFFDSGSPKITADGEEILNTLADQVAKLPNKLAIEGHTDSVQYGPKATYTNWELSADRANAARRILQSHDLRPDQVTQVRGFADQRLRTPDKPTDPANRRVSIIVLYLPKVGEDGSDKSGDAKPEDGNGGDGKSGDGKPVAGGKPAGGGEAAGKEAPATAPKSSEAPKKE